MIKMDDHINKLIKLGVKLNSQYKNLSDIEKKGCEELPLFKQCITIIQQIKWDNLRSNYNEGSIFKHPICSDVLYKDNKMRLM